MESEVDWSKAPEGATHWMPESQYWQAGFWKRVGEANYFFEGGEWVFSGAKPFGHPALVKRPATPQWSGVGLPPVGCECIGANKYRGNVVAHVMSGGVKEAIFQAEKDWFFGTAENFKPIRTPEQLAAEEREKAVEEMWSVYWQPHAATAKQGLGLLYDAGYRKQDAQ